MPATYTINLEKEIVLTRAHGVFTDAEFLALAHEIAGDPRFDPGMRMFSDFSKISKNLLSAKSLAEVPMVIRRAPDSRSAVVLNDRTLDYGLFRMYAAYCEGAKIRPPRSFHSHADALSYINEGVPAEKAIGADFPDAALVGHPDPV